MFLKATDLCIFMHYKFVAFSS